MNKKKINPAKIERKSIFSCRKTFLRGIYTDFDQFIVYELFIFLVFLWLQWKRVWLYKCAGTRIRSTLRHDFPFSITKIVEFYLLVYFRQTISILMFKHIVCVDGLSTWWYQRGPLMATLTVSLSWFPTIALIRYELNCFFFFFVLWSSSYYLTRKTFAG